MSQVTHAKTVEDIRSEMKTLHALIPKVSPTENEFAKLYLIELARREGLEEELVRAREQIQELQLLVGIPQSFEPPAPSGDEMGISKSTEKLAQSDCEACGVCEYCSEFIVDHLL